MAKAIATIKYSFDESISGDNSVSSDASFEFKTKKTFELLQGEDDDKHWKTQSRPDDCTHQAVAKYFDALAGQASEVMGQFNSLIRPKKPQQAVQWKTGPSQKQQQRANWSKAKAMMMKKASTNYYCAAGETPTNYNNNNNDNDINNDNKSKKKTPIKALQDLPLIKRPTPSFYNNNSNFDHRNPRTPTTRGGSGGGGMSDGRVSDSTATYSSSSQPSSDDVTYTSLSEAAYGHSHKSSKNQKKKLSLPINSTLSCQAPPTPVDGDVYLAPVPASPSYFNHLHGEVTDVNILNVNHHHHHNSEYQNLNILENNNEYDDDDEREDWTEDEKTLATNEVELGMSFQGIQVQQQLLLRDPPPGTSNIATRSMNSNSKSNSNSTSQSSSDNPYTDASLSSALESRQYRPDAFSLSDEEEEEYSTSVTANHAGGSFGNLDHVRQGQQQLQQHPHGHQLNPLDLTDDEGSGSCTSTSLSKFDNQQQQSMSHVQSSVSHKNKNNNNNNSHYNKTNKSVDGTLFAATYNFNQGGGVGGGSIASHTTGTGTYQSVSSKPKAIFPLEKTRNPLDILDGNDDSGSITTNTTAEGPSSPIGYQRTIPGAGAKSPSRASVLRDGVVQPRRKEVSSGSGGPLEYSDSSAGSGTDTTGSTNESENFHPRRYHGGTTNERPLSFGATSASTQRATNSNHYPHRHRQQQAQPQQHYNDDQPTPRIGHQRGPFNFPVDSGSVTSGTDEGHSSTDGTRARTTRTTTQNNPLIPSQSKPMMHGYATTTTTTATTTTTTAAAAAATTTVNNNLQSTTRYPSIETSPSEESEISMYRPDPMSNDDDDDNYDDDFDDDFDDDDDDDDNDGDYYNYNGNRPDYYSNGSDSDSVLVERRRASKLLGGRDPSPRKHTTPQPPSSPPKQQNPKQQQQQQQPYRVRIPRDPTPSMTRRESSPDAPRTVKSWSNNHDMHKVSQLMDASSSNPTTTRTTTAIRPPVETATSLVATARRSNYKHRAPPPIHVTSSQVSGGKQQQGKKNRVAMTRPRQRPSNPLYHQHRPKQNKDKEDPLPQQSFE